MVDTGKKQDRGIVGGFLRTGHGAGRGRIHVEVPPIDELPPPVAAPVAAPSGAVKRRQDGKLSGSEAARELGRRGGEAKAKRVRLVDALGLSKLAEDSAFLPYRTAADEFVSHHVAELATQAGGVVGAAATSMVASAALQLAASRYMFDLASASGDPDLFAQGSRLANDSRQNLISAYAIAVKAAEVRAAAKSTVSPMEAIRQRVRHRVATETHDLPETEARELAADAGVA